MIFAMAVLASVGQAKIISTASVQNCTVAACCEPMWFGTECHVASATVVNKTGENAYCDCGCEHGWFSDQDQNCYLCGGHGLNYFWLNDTCECENNWTNTEFSNRDCSVCPDPFGGDDCDQCAEGYVQDTYPECNVCAEGYFRDTRPLSPIETGSRGCLSIVDGCNADYCSAYDLGNLNWGENGVKEAFFDAEAGTCNCTCKDGWFGDFKDDELSHNSDNQFYAACKLCSGHGAAFDPDAAFGEKCTCANAWTGGLYAALSDVDDCNYCPIGADEDHDCDRCDEGWTNYPDCDTYVSGEFYSFNWAAFFGITIPLIVLTFGFVLFRHIKRKREENGGDYRFMV